MEERWEHRSAAAVVVVVVPLVLPVLQDGEDNDVVVLQHTHLDLALGEEADEIDTAAEVVLYHILRRVLVLLGTQDRMGDHQEEGKEGTDGKHDGVLVVVVAAGEEDHRHRDDGDAVDGNFLPSLLEVGVAGFLSEVSGVFHRGDLFLLDFDAM